MDGWMDWISPDRSISRSPSGDNNIIISQIYCNYIYTSKELYDMENREASDLEAVRAEKE